MSRPRGAKNRPKAPTADGEVDQDHNKTKPTGKPAKEPLTDAQLQSLFFNHKKRYEADLKKFKAAQKALKDTGKIIKAEGGSVAEIKIAISLEEDGGSEAMKERLERELRVARWIGAEVGTQFSLLDDTDRTPSVDRAESEGHRAGLKAEPANPPNHYGTAQQQSWLRGWHAGQKVNADRIAQKHDDQRAADAKDFDGGSEAA